LKKEQEKKVPKTDNVIILLVRASEGVVCLAQQMAKKKGWVDTFSNNN